jgi:predicted metalloprotease with PDZ domain
MNAVWPHDWKSFFREHLESRSPEPPLGGLVRSGWKLVYTDQKSGLIEDLEQVHKVDLLWPEWQTWGFTDQRSSIGLLVQDDGTVLDSAPRLSAYNAGVMPGMRLTGINGGKFSIAALEQAIRATANGGPLELQVANGNSSAIRRVEYRGGLRYPHLERDPGKPDMLRDIVAPRTTAGSVN